MTDDKSGTRSSVGLLDIATRVPGLIADTPTILRGVITGFGARPSAKTSIGKVFQDRAAQYADKIFLKFEDQEITYRDANETVNRYAAALAEVSGPSELVKLAARVFREDLDSGDAALLVEMIAGASSTPGSSARSTSA